jgi:hypothetical protein
MAFRMASGASAASPLEEVPIGKWVFSAMKLRFKVMYHGKMGFTIDY